jgi:hydrogenase maturation protein HypF
MQMTISGCVQGVGFRPFIFHLARKHQVHGLVKNTSSGVEIDIEGPLKALRSFEDDLTLKKPPQATYDSIQKKILPLCFFPSFSTEPSTTDTCRSIPLLPDTAICDACKQEFVRPLQQKVPVSVYSLHRMWPKIFFV